MRFDGLTLFGVASLSIMLLCYALERRSPWFIFGMASACVAAGIYGFLQGAWPFAVIEAIWAIIAYIRWWQDRASAEPQTPRKRSG
jgi:presenilin-like A22 family membrane protease